MHNYSALKPQKHHLQAKISVNVLIQGQLVTIWLDGREHKNVEGYILDVLKHVQKVVKRK